MKGFPGIFHSGFFFDFVPPSPFPPLKLLVTLYYNQYTVVNDEFVDFCTPYSKYAFPFQMSHCREWSYAERFSERVDIGKLDYLFLRF
jgi:hypothetical protein